MDNRDGVLIPNLRLTQRVVTSASLVLASSVASLAVTRGANAGHLYQLASPVAGSTAGDLMAIVQCVMDECDLRAVILHVAVDGEELVTGALGESMTGVPATTDMRFRNGAVAISLVATLMLTLVDDGTIGLDDPIGTWLPDLPDAGTATFRMLANMTAGYRDYVQNPDFIDVLIDDPFRHFSTEDLIGYSLIQPRLFAPGANWEYSHTNYVILGLALEAATGEPVEQLMQERVLDPLGPGNTVNSATAATAATAAIHEPVLHAFTSEHREWLGIEPGKRFYEESTYWNPSWTITRGTVQTSDMRDFAAAMVAVGKGTLLSPESSAAQLDPGLLRFGEPLEGYFSCRTLDERYNYSLGVVFRGPWVMQNPLFGGYSGVAGYLSSRKLVIAVATTYGEGSFDETGEYRFGNASQLVFNAIVAYLVPELAAPVAG